MKKNINRFCLLILSIMLQESIMSSSHKTPVSSSNATTITPNTTFHPIIISSPSSSYANVLNNKSQATSAASSSSPNVQKSDETSRSLNFSSDHFQQSRITSTSPFTFFCWNTSWSGIEWFRYAIWELYHTSSEESKQEDDNFQNLKKIIDDSKNYFQTKNTNKFYQFKTSKINLELCHHFIPSLSCNLTSNNQLNFTVQINKTLKIVDTKKLIESINNHFNQEIDTLANLIIKSEYDIVCLQECPACFTEALKIKINNTKNLYYFDYNQNNKSTGCCILYKVTEATKAKVEEGLKKANEAVAEKEKQSQLIAERATVAAEKIADNLESIAREAAEHLKRLDEEKEQLQSTKNFSQKLKDAKIKSKNARNDANIARKKAEELKKAAEEEPQKISPEINTNQIQKAKEKEEYKTADKIKTAVRKLNALLKNKQADPAEQKKAESAVVKEIKNINLEDAVKAYITKQKLDNYQLPLINGIKINIISIHMDKHVKDDLIFLNCLNKTELTPYGLILMDFLKKEAAFNENFIICGDFNSLPMQINMAIESYNTSVEATEKKLTCTCLNRGPSVDNFLYNITQNNYNSDVQPIKNSSMLNLNMSHVPLILTTTPNQNLFAATAAAVQQPQQQQKKSHQKQN